MAKEQHLSFIRYIAHQTYRFAFHTNIYSFKRPRKVKERLNFGFKL